ncbi:MAG: redox-sensing transcriptional repressor Rex [Spirochaetales bacterium]|nr:redox-sensing transcriptional repressor Rex [Spirochaetales bacterium]
MITIDNISIPLPTIRRFPAYLRLLKEHANRGEVWISATTLAEELKLKPIQVRKDMACTGVEGKPKVGFLVSELVLAIEHYLGWDNTTDAILIGAGNLGAALIGYKGFENNGLRIIAVFDKDRRKVGSQIGGIVVSQIEDLAKTVDKFGINIAIITVPAHAAQSVAEMAVEAGIKGIWNFAPKNLNLSDNIVIQKTDLVTSFAELSAKLINHLDEQKQIQGK